MSEPARIPEQGRDAEELLAEIEDRHAEDIDWRGGRAFSLVYNVDDHAHENLIEQVGVRYLHDNALNPFKYPSVLQMELDVIAMTADLLGTAPNAGAMSSGGTESIFLAVQEQVRVPVAADGRADVGATEAALTERTALVVGSAPCYPYGLIDPITELAALAEEREILFHTDACLGGWLLPWLERLGEEVPPWDFRVPGVTSISADIHKYGYTFKGASVVLYRSRDLLERQFFWYDDWPGGLYASGTSAGTRSAAPIAGAWAAINHLGQDGYLRLTEVVRDTSRRLRDGISAIEGLRLSHQPALSVFEFGSDTLDIGAVGDVMDDRGWNLDRQQGGLHLMVSPYHSRIVDRFLDDLAAAAANHGDSRGVSASYGGVV